MQLLDTCDTKWQGCCINSITVQHVSGETSTKTGSDIHGNTCFEFGDDECCFHTSCSKCIQVGDTEGECTITELKPDYDADGIPDCLADLCAGIHAKNKDKEDLKHCDLCLSSCE